MSTFNERYQIINELGRGGMGVVYKAKDTMLGRIVAVKRLLSRDNKMAIDRFMGEAKSIAALNHPNIIQIYDIGRDEEGLFITTEFVDGLDLYKFMQTRQQLPLKVALKLYVPICKAMSYAHEAGVIHRDIKPANILLTKDGQPKIADFGLARTESMKDLEKTGMIMGSKLYASPEQFMDAKHIDHRTDIYSLGAMFYEMITGKSPQFFRETDLPPVFAPLVLKMMQRDPAMRYQSVKQMLAELMTVVRSGASAPAAAPAPATPRQPVAATAAKEEMILVPAGAFRFGPQGQTITLPAFYIDRYPVTNAQFAQFKPSHVFPPEWADHPATKMTWVEANAYARMIGKRLPTEQEWEKAARGIDGRPFPWGNQFSPERCNTIEAQINQTTPVNAYPEGRSVYGAIDMAGNVWEWTTTYLDERQTARVLKGGAFNGAAKFALCHARFAYPEQGLLPTAGFRCAMSA